MTNQPPESGKGVSTEFATMQNAFNTWNIEKNEAAQAVFSASLSGSHTLVFGVYGTPADHPEVGAPEAWTKAFEAAYKGHNRQVADIVGEGLCCADPADGRIKGIVFYALEAHAETSPKQRTNEPVYVAWVLEKLHWLWRQTFGNQPYPIIRTTELPSAMFFEEQCRAEFPISEADAWLALLFDTSPDKRRQGMAAFTQTEDREWLETLFRVLWRETDSGVVDAAHEVIAHFRAQPDAAVYFVKKLANDHGITDRFPNNGPIARDRAILRRLGTPAIPAMLQGVEHAGSSDIGDLLNILAATGDARVKPALEALVSAPTTKEWVQRLIKAALEKLS